VHFTSNAAVTPSSCNACRSCALVSGTMGCCASPAGCRRCCCRCCCCRCTRLARALSSGGEHCTCSRCRVLLCCRNGPMQIEAVPIASCASLVTDIGICCCHAIRQVCAAAVSTAQPPAAGRHHHRRQWVCSPRRRLPESLHLCAGGSLTLSPASHMPTVCAQGHYMSSWHQGDCQASVVTR
jgi:hypothetical protein